MEEPRVPLSSQVEPLLRSPGQAGQEKLGPGRFQGRGFANRTHATHSLTFAFDRGFPLCTLCTVACKFMVNGWVNVAIWKKAARYSPNL